VIYRALGAKGSHVYNNKMTLPQHRFPEEAVSWLTDNPDGSVIKPYFSDRDLEKLGHLNATGIQPGTNL